MSWVYDSPEQHPQGKDRLTSGEPGDVASGTPRLVKEVGSTGRKRSRRTCSNAGKSMQAERSDAGGRQEEKGRERMMKSTWVVPTLRGGRGWNRRRDFTQRRCLWLMNLPSSTAFSYPTASTGS
jgi:hypothetical protein